MFLHRVRHSLQLNKYVCNTIPLMPKILKLIQSLTITLPERHNNHRVCVLCAGHNSMVHFMQIPKLKVFCQTSWKTSA